MLRIFHMLKFDSVFDLVTGVSSNTNFEQRAKFIHNIIVLCIEVIIWNICSLIDQIPLIFIWCNILISNNTTITRDLNYNLFILCSDFL